MVEDFTQHQVFWKFVGFAGTFLFTARWLVELQATRRSRRGLRAAGTPSVWAK